MKMIMMIINNDNDNNHDNDYDNNNNHKVWDEITYPFLNFNCAAVEV